MSAISLHNLSRVFANGDGLKPVSLSVESGEFLVLLGPSGSGKTTLLRLLSGFERPDSGTISIGGRDITDTDPESRPTAMVFQSHALWPHLSVFDNVAFGLRVKRVSKKALEEKVTETLDLVQLSHLARRKPGQLSGGQRQRVALARALAVEPAVLLLDEPLSALDARLRDDLRVELRAIQQRLGLTAVYVTHDQDDALALADQVAVLKDGELQQLGRPQTIYEQPANPFVARFCGDSVLIPCRVVSQEADGTLVCLAEGGIPFRAAGGSAEATHLSVRPQALTVGTTMTPNSLAATVAHRRYAGGLFEVELRTARGLKVTIHTGDELLQVGASCYLTAPVERLWGVLDSPTTSPRESATAGR